MKTLMPGILVCLFLVNAFAIESSYQKGKTADDQVMSGQRDTDITRTIREKIMADSSLSTNAHNIKVITENNRVILKGNVASSLEKEKVERIAKDVAGKNQVINNTVISK